MGAPIGAASPGTDVTELNNLLAGAGLAVDRELALPGTDSVAYVIVVSGDEALDAWQATRHLVPVTGRHPVIAGGPIDYGGDSNTELEQTIASARFLEQDSFTVASELAKAETVGTPKWFSDRQSYLEVTAAELQASLPLPDYPYPKDQFTSNTEILSGTPLPVVEIVLLPTRNSWEAPAYLLWGGWNDVPFPNENVALLKYWAESYGAEVVAITSDVVELAVSSPPVDDEAALSLAREQFLYAPDIVWQGTGDINVLAAALLDAPVWFFWWD